MALPVLSERILQFQSLFWWIEGWDIDEQGNYQEAILFQSLFWWIEGWDRFSLSAVFGMKPSFNPCSGGLRAGTGLCPTDFNRRKSFNPCSGGLRAGTAKAHRGRCRQRCFNPCSGGLRAGTPSTTARTAPGPVFQSLFWWIEGWDLVMWRVLTPARWFQSLFWWIEGWDRCPTRRLCSTLISFNPCSGGLRAGTWPRSPSHRCATGFNPCSGGLRAGTCV